MASTTMTMATTTMTMATTTMTMATRATTMAVIEKDDTLLQKKVAKILKWSSTQEKAYAMSLRKRRDILEKDLNSGRIVSKSRSQCVKAIKGLISGKGNVNIVLVSVCAKTGVQFTWMQYSRNELIDESIRIGTKVLEDGFVKTPVVQKRGGEVRIKSFSNFVKNVYSAGILLRIENDSDLKEIIKFLNILDERKKQELGISEDIGFSAEKPIKIVPCEIRRSAPGTINERWFIESPDGEWHDMLKPKDRNVVPFSEVEEVSKLGYWSYNLANMQISSAGQLKGKVMFCPGQYTKTMVPIVLKDGTEIKDDRGVDWNAVWNHCLFENPDMRKKYQLALTDHKGVAKGNARVSQITASAFSGHETPMVSYGIFCGKFKSPDKKEDFDGFAFTSYEWIARAVNENLKIKGRKIIFAPKVLKGLVTQMRPFVFNKTCAMLVSYVFQLCVMLFVSELSDIIAYEINSITPEEEEEVKENMAYLFYQDKYAEKHGGKPHPWNGKFVIFYDNELATKRKSPWVPVGVENKQVPIPDFITDLNGLKDFHNPLGRKVYDKVKGESQHRLSGPRLLPPLELHKNAMNSASTQLAQTFATSDDPEEAAKFFEMLTFFMVEKEMSAFLEGNAGIVKSKNIVTNDENDSDDENDENDSDDEKQSRNLLDSFSTSLFPTIRKYIPLMHRSIAERKLSSMGKKIKKLNIPIKGEHHVIVPDIGMIFGEKVLRIRKENDECIVQFLLNGAQIQSGIALRYPKADSGEYVKFIGITISEIKESLTISDIDKAILLDAYASLMPGTCVVPSSESLMNLHGGADKDGDTLFTFMVEFISNLQKFKEGAFLPAKVLEKAAKSKEVKIQSVSPNVKQNKAEGCEKFRLIKSEYEDTIEKLLLKCFGSVAIQSKKSKEILRQKIMQYSNVVENLTPEELQEIVERNDTDLCDQTIQKYGLEFGEKFSNYDAMGLRNFILYVTAHIPSVGRITNLMCVFTTALWAVKNIIQVCGEAAKHDVDLSKDEDRRALTAGLDVKDAERVRGWIRTIRCIYNTAFSMHLENAKTNEEIEWGTIGKVCYTPKRERTLKIIPIQSLGVLDVIVHGQPQSPDDIDNARIRAAKKCQVKLENVVASDIVRKIWALSNKDWRDFCNNAEVIIQRLRTCKTIPSSDDSKSRQIYTLRRTEEYNSPIKRGGESDFDFKDEIDFVISKNIFDQCETMKLTIGNILKSSVDLEVVKRNFQEVVIDATKKPPAGGVQIPHFWDLCQMKLTSKIFTAVNIVWEGSRVTPENEDEKSEESNMSTFVRFFANLKPQSGVMRRRNALGQKTKGSQIVIFDVYAELALPAFAHLMDFAKIIAIPKLGFCDPKMPKWAVDEILAFGQQQNAKHSYIHLSEISALNHMQWLYDKITSVYRKNVFEIKNIFGNDGETSKALEKSKKAEMSELFCVLKNMVRFILKPYNLVDRAKLLILSSWTTDEGAEGSQILRPVETPYTNPKGKSAFRKWGMFLEEEYIAFAHWMGHEGVRREELPEISDPSRYVEASFEPYGDRELKEGDEVSIRNGNVYKVDDDEETIVGTTEQFLNFTEERQIFEVSQSDGELCINIPVEIFLNEFAKTPTNLPENVIVGINQKTDDSIKEMIGEFMGEQEVVVNPNPVSVNGTEIYDGLYIKIGNTYKFVAQTSNLCKRGEVGTLYSLYGEAENGLTKPMVGVVKNVFVDDDQILLNISRLTGKECDHLKECEAVTTDEMKDARNSKIKEAIEMLNRAKNSMVEKRESDIVKVWLTEKHGRISIVKVENAERNDVIIEKKHGRLIAREKNGRTVVVQ